jgi:hypothetical protein
MLEQFSDEI